MEIHVTMLSVEKRRIWEAGSDPGQGDLVFLVHMRELLGGRDISVAVQQGK